ncbi:hypothetical protein BY996DRAFT_8688946 [Phakopsora pachyrhizi]|nr:hypothetical protein BY996DRAFT_8688946 [Phakopsora pachyrhizi]
MSDSEQAQQPEHINIRVVDSKSQEIFFSRSRQLQSWSFEVVWRILDKFKAIDGLVEVFRPIHGGCGYGRRRLEVRSRAQLGAVCCAQLLGRGPRMKVGTVRGLVMARTPLRMGMMEEAQQLLCSSKGQSKALGVGWQAQRPVGQG